MNHLTIEKTNKMKTNKLLFIALILSFFSLKGQSGNDNFYSFYKHKAQLSDFYLKKNLPVSGICFEKVCGLDLVTIANAKEYYSTATYVLLVTEIINKNLEADFYLMSTFEKLTGRLIENKFFLKSLKSKKDPKTIIYQTTNLLLNKKDPSIFTLETVEEKSISSVINPTDIPKLSFRKIKTERFKINLNGSFSRPIESKSSADNQVQSNKPGAIDVQKIIFLKNEILTAYNFDFNDVATNKFFASKIKEYKPELKDITDIKLSDSDKESIAFIDKKIEEINKTNAMQKGAKSKFSKTNDMKNANSNQTPTPSTPTKPKTPIKK
jgi:hypothetical protein